MRRKRKTRTNKLSINSFRQKYTIMDITWSAFFFHLSGPFSAKMLNFIISHCILFLAYPYSSLNSQWQSQRIIPIITKTENIIGILPANPLPNRGSKWREWIPSFWKTSSLQKNTTWTNINKKSALLLNKAMSDGCWNKTFVNVKSSLVCSFCGHVQSIEDWVLLIYRVIS